MTEKCLRFGKVNLLSIKNNLLPVTFYKVSFPPMRGHLYILLLRTLSAPTELWQRLKRHDVLVAEPWTLKDLALEKLDFSLRATMCRGILNYTQYPRKLMVLSSYHYWKSNRLLILLFIKYIMNALPFLLV